MTDDDLNITRRKVLAATGAVGAAGAGAGLGTSALFTDSERFEGNALTAGSLDLAVHLEAEYNGATTDQWGPTRVNGEPGVNADLTDIKPGDSGWAKFRFELDDNPAYLWLCGELTGSAENGYPEPEPVDDNGEGELEEAIEVQVSYSDADGTGKTPILSGTLRTVLDALETGIPLDGDETPGVLSPGEQSCFPARTTAEEPAGPCVLVEMDVPRSVGNEIQTDSVTFDLQFYAEQCRHNDGSRNPCCTAANTDLSTGTADWKVVSGPDGAEGAEGPATLVTDPNDAWVTSGCADWVNPFDADTNDSDPAGEYVYEVTFDVPEDAGDCTLTIGEFAADNPVEFSLDGESLGGYDQEDAYGQLRGPIETEVSPGSNTLSATVVNLEGSGGNPTGLLACATLTCPCKLPTEGVTYGRNAT